MGVDVDGAFAEYVVRPVETLIVPPQRIDPATLAVLTDAVGTPYHALARIARVQPGETVAVLGIGGIGSNAVQVARALGARVIAVSRGEEKLALARRLGAEAAVRMEDAAAACGPNGPDVVVQCAPSAALDEAAIALGGYGARIVLVGTTVEAFRAKASDFVWRELSLMGSRGFTPDDVRAVIDLYLAGKIETDHLTARTRPLDEANEALEDLRAGRVLRSVLIP
jgi:D-arabinose 1-dehydrogenase-like Zn-dependent alcohol dehydrogenase